MTLAPRELSGEKPLVIRRGRVDSVEIYEIKDSELEQLEHGSPVDLHLNFAIFLLSISASALFALGTADFRVAAVKTTFIVIAVVGILGGVFLLILWWRFRSSLRDVCRVIRKRIPSEQIVTAQISTITTETVTVETPSDGGTTPSG